MNQEHPHPVQTTQAHFLVISTGTQGRTVTDCASLGAAQQIYRDLEDAIRLLRRLGYPQEVALQIRELQRSSGDGTTVAQSFYPHMPFLRA